MTFFLDLALCLAVLFLGGLMVFVFMALPYIFLFGACMHFLLTRISAIRKSVGEKRKARRLAKILNKYQCRGLSDRQFG